MIEIVKEKLAFSGEKFGYLFKATYLLEPKGEALIEIYKGDKLVKELLFPAYKIWNIAAHAEDIAKSLDDKNEDWVGISLGVDMRREP